VPNGRKGWGRRKRGSTSSILPHRRGEKGRRDTDFNIFQPYPFILVVPEGRGGGERKGKGGKLIAILISPFFPLSLSPTPREGGGEEGKKKRKRKRREDSHIIAVLYLFSASQKRAEGERGEREKGERERNVPGYWSFLARFPAKGEKKIRRREKRKKRKPTGLFLPASPWVGGEGEGKGNRLIALHEVCLSSRRKGRGGKGGKKKKAVELGDPTRRKGTRAKKKRRSARQ